MKPRLLIATNNLHKIEELRSLLTGLPIELVTPKHLELDLDVTEDGATYAENAAKKARAFATTAGLIALADDSGLEVDALGGAPGLYSSRYLSRPGATDADRRAYLLENLRGKPRPWTAHFHAAIAIAEPAGRLQIAEADCPGEIVPEERGTDGFGYDAIFQLSGRSKTMAELSPEEKNRLSHRALAVMKARPILAAMLGL